MDKRNKKIPKIDNRTLGLVCEDEYECSENTMEINRLSEEEKAIYGISSTKCKDGTPFDLGPSGGAISPFTEVNADHQGVISEVPRKPEFRPNDKR